MATTNSYVPNLDAIENQLAQYPPPQQTVMLLRSGFADMCRLLNALHLEQQQTNRLLIRAQRGETNGEQE
jgi:hypothetical protein